MAGSLHFRAPWPTDVQSTDVAIGSFGTDAQFPAQPLSSGGDRSRAREVPQLPKSVATQTRGEVNVSERRELRR